MKLEEYFKIMDCASEQDIIEMMQSRRFRQIPSAEEDMMKQSDFQEKKELQMTRCFGKNHSGEESVSQSEQQEKKDIHMTRRGLISGSAVAAVLLAMNVGIGGFLLHDSVGTTDSTVVEVSELEPLTTTAKKETAEDVTTAASQKASAQQTTTKKSASRTAKTTVSRTARTTSETKTEAVTTQSSEAQSDSASTQAQQTTATNTRQATATNTRQTPASNTRQTPASNTRRTPASNTRQTPASNTRQTPASNTRQTPASNTRQTPAPNTQTVTPQSDRLTYSLVPADRTYESGGTNAIAPVVFHAAAGEPVRMQLTVQNDPGAAYFGVQYQMETFNLLSQTDLRYYSGNVSFTHFSGDQFRILNIGGTGDGVMKAPDGAALAEFTLLAPSQPGRYVIQKFTPEIYLYDVNPDGTVTSLPASANVYADAEQTVPVDCDILGVEIIVDEAESTSEYQINPETTEGPTVYMNPITAHAGQKNVPVNVYIRGCDPIVSGYLRFGYDSALKSQLYNFDQVYDTDVTSSSRLGINLDGTLLEDAMLMDSSTVCGNLIQIFFNNYRSFGLDDDGEPTVFHNGASQTDAVIAENGILFTMYFDMPEECGHYQIFATDGSLAGGAAEEPGYLPDQAIRNFIPCDITVIP